MKLLKILAILVFTLFCIASCGSTNSIVNKTRGSVVRIHIADPTESGTCTGFVVTPTVVLTAAHCVGTTMYGDGVATDVIKKDDYFDLAALKLDLGKRPLILRDAPTQEGELVTGIGYALSWSIPIGIDVKVLLPNYALFPQYSAGVVTSGVFMPGMSGGPVIDRNGEVVAIIQRGMRGQPIGHGAGVLIIRAFLLDAGVEVK